MSFELLKAEINECLIRAKSKETIDTLSYLMEFAENHLNNGWISVDDKLPLAHRPVLVIMTDGKVWQGVLNGDEWYVYGWSKNPFVVTHWQPLPELPQKKVKRTLVLALLADNYPFVLVHKKTYALRLCDETSIDELNLDDYSIDCKMTGQTIIDYVDGKVIFETTKELSNE